MSTPLVTRAYNLGLKAVPNFVGSLTEQEISYYESHLDEIPNALRRGFVIPVNKSVTVTSPPSAPMILNPPSTLFKTSDTDLGWWIEKEEQFATKHLGITIDLRKRFDIPEKVPWKSVMPVFDAGGFNNRRMVEIALKGPGHAVYEEADVMKYSGSEAYAQPTLHLIENSLTPTVSTMRKLPNDLRATGESYLRLRGYGFAFALRHFAKSDFLDPKTFTWFPEDRLPDGDVARGGWYSGDRKVRFGWNYPDDWDPCGGARVAMPVFLKP